MKIRELATADIPEVLRVQDDAYLPQLIESAETFLRKMKLFPAGALGCVDGERLCGYLFCHPWTDGEIVSLDSATLQLPVNADCLYIHDLAVEKACRGRGVARHLMDRGIALAKKAGLRQFGLVAVQDSEPFWARFGFATLRSFEYVPGVPASFMTMSLGQQ